jgi:hypothetical protein
MTINYIFFQYVKERFLNDVRIVEVNGVEPMTPCVQGRCSSQLSYTPRTSSNLLVVPSRFELLTPTLSV